jgi:isopropylmalate/homocitrate/citramalate synthase
MKFKEPISDLLQDPTIYTKDKNFCDPADILIYDTTLRDGEQTPRVAFSPENKFLIAKALSDIGVDILDMGFPTVSVSERDALRRVMLGKQRGDIREDMEILVMCRSVQADVDSTIHALSDVDIDPGKLTFFIFTAASDLHIKYKLGKTLLKREGKPLDKWLELPLSFYRDANNRMISEVISYAKKMGVKSVEAGMGEDGSRANIDYLIELGQACVDSGADRLSVADTVGVLTPDSTQFYMSRLKKALPQVPWVVHFHNDFDLATINTITALSMGVEAATVTVNGMGERAGNAPMHSVVAALWKLYGIRLPRFKYEHLNDLSKLVENLSGIPIQPNEPLVGMNVYTHEAGIHTAGVLIDRRIYESIPAEEFGRSQSFAFGKHTGTKIIEQVLKENFGDLERAGISADSDLVKKVTFEVKRLREERAETEDLSIVMKDHYRKLKQLGISKKEVVDIALALGQKI